MYCYKMQLMALWYHLSRGLNNSINSQSTVFQLIISILAFSNKFWPLSLQVQQIQGVHRVHVTHFCTLCSNSYVGGLKLEVSHDADPKYVISHTQMIFRDIGVRELFVQLDYERQHNTTLWHQYPERSYLYDWSNILYQHWGLLPILDIPSRNYYKGS